MEQRTFTGASMSARRVLLVAVLALAINSTAAHAQSSQPLTLRDALSRALAADQLVPAAKARIRGAQAGIFQADRIPNPTLGVEIENFAGSRNYRGNRSQETTAFLQQTIELGNKRAARTGVAKSELEMVRARNALRVLDLFREVEIAWIEVIAASVQVRIAEERLTIARQLRSEIVRRVEAGRDPLHVQSRADAQISLEQISLDQARAAVRVARANLAGYWRGSPDFEVDFGAFEDAIMAADGKGFNVEIALLEADRDLADARLVLQRAAAIPDPAIRLGVRRFNETNDTAVIAGISIPLPLFDTNEGNIKKAEADKRAAELEITSARTALRRELARLRARLSVSAAEAKRIQSEVIPQAQRTVQLIRDGLERGGFSYIEFIEAQRTLNDARLRWIEALKTFHLDNAAVARLTGRHARLNVPRKGKR